MRSTHMVDTIETHTAGEPTRIAVSGVPVAAGPDSVAAKRDRFAADHDDVRTLLLQEPRGHRNMFGAVLVEPGDSRADCGLFFMDTEGYLDMCGHGTIGAVTALIETGTIAYESGDGPVVVETPSGLVTTDPVVDDGSVRDVTLTNVSTSYCDSATVDVDGLGSVPVDVVYAGNFFALVDADRIGVDVEHDPVETLIEHGLAVRRRVNEETSIRHPRTDDPARVDLTEFYRSRDGPDRNVTVFGSGQFDRSPCGTGTCAKMTLLAERGALDVDEPYVHESRIGTRFEGRLLGTKRVDGATMYDAAVTGSAYITGRSTYLKDPADPVHGFDPKADGSERSHR